MSPQISSFWLLCLFCVLLPEKILFCPVWNATCNCSLINKTFVNNVCLYTMSLSGREKLHAALQSLYILFAMCKLCDPLGHVKFDKQWAWSFLNSLQWQWTASGRSLSVWFHLFYMTQTRETRGLMKLAHSTPLRSGHQSGTCLNIWQKSGCMQWNHLSMLHAWMYVCVWVCSLVICQSASEIESGSTLCL